MKICTNKKQSKKLVDLGFDVNTADMFYRNNGDVKLMWEHLPDIEITSPAWSLSALFKFLKEKDFFPEIIPNEDCILMDIYWFGDDEGNVSHPVHFIRVEGNDFIDASFNLICKLKENNLI